MTLITLSISLVIVLLLALLLAKCTTIFKENLSMIEACKVIVANRFYENFKHMTLQQKLKEVERMKKLVKDDHIEEFSHPREFKIAMRYYINIMEHDIQLDMALIKVDNLLMKMEEDESDNKEVEI